MFTQKHGGHDTKTTTLFILLTITLSTTALLAYANNPQEQNALDQNSQSCQIACHTDTECDDNNLLTTDQCSNAGTCQAECTHIVIGG